jgi:hypothetical protein
MIELRQKDCQLNFRWQHSSRRPKPIVLASATTGHCELTAWVWIEAKLLAADPSLLGRFEPTYRPTLFNKLRLF